MIFVLDILNMYLCGSLEKYNGVHKSVTDTAPAVFLVFHRTASKYCPGSGAGRGYRDWGSVLGERAPSVGAGTARLATDCAPRRKTTKMKEKIENVQPKRNDNGKAEDYLDSQGIMSKTV